MFHVRYLLLAVAAAALSGGDARSFDLSEMINRTVCAIRVYTDVDPDRIPKRIKAITCQDKTDEGCVANGIEHRHCCHHKNKMECAEMRDTVRVFNKKLNATQSIEMPVGCACMIRGAAGAVQLAR